MMKAHGIAKGKNIILEKIPAPVFPKLSDTLPDWIIKGSLEDENGIPALK